MEKYYTPSIEEFYVGFEFEAETLTVAGNTTQYEKFTIKHPQEIANLFEEDMQGNGLFGPPRVKYLDREDIEELGFFYSSRFPHVDNFFEIRTGPKIDELTNYISLHLFINHKAVTKNGTVWIEKKYKAGGIHRYFTGVVKNKSELKRLLIQLGILNED